MIARCDKFLTLMHRAGDDYDNFSAVQNKLTANLKLNLYERATKSFTRDLVKMKDWVARDKPCNVVVTIAKPSDKRAKTAEAGGPPPTTARREWGGANAGTTTPALRGPPTARTVGWGSDWGAAARRFPKQNFTPDQSRQRGDFIFRAGREQGALQLDVAKEFCQNFAVKGLYCANPD